MKKRFVILFSILISVLHVAYAGTKENRKIPVIQVSSVWDFDHLNIVKKNINNNIYTASYNSLLLQADSLLCLQPLSVMMKSKLPASGDKHDYISLARYTWPDPTKPDGLPYITRDGIANPELFEYDRYNLGITSERIVTLTLAWFFSGNEKYAEKASEIIKVWFINEDTRMNPNLEFSQIVPGKNNNKGRSLGLIDTYSFIEVTEAATLLEKSNSFSHSDQMALKEWFGKLSKWMIYSPQGIEESQRANNHSCSYDIQVIAFSIYSGNTSIAQKIITEFFPKRLFKQVEPDGSQPLELARPLGFHYSRENITHFVNIMLLAKRMGMMVDNTVSNDGRSFYKAVDFLTPYVGKDVSNWPYKQISGWDEEIQYFCKDLCRIANFLNPTYQKKYLELYNKYHKYNVAERFNLLYVK